MLRAIPEARLELLEMFKTVKGASKDEKCPFFADQLDCGRDRAQQRRLFKTIDIHQLPAFAAFFSLSNRMKAHRG